MSCDRELDPLIRRAQEGDREAFSGIAERLDRRLVSYCLALTRQCEAARELAQETWVMVLRKLGLYRSEAGTFLTWVKTVALNLHRSQLRRQCLAHAAPDRPPATPVDPALEAEHRDLLARVTSRLERLPLRKRRALWAYLRCEPYPEIVRILGVSRPNARAIICRLIKEERVNCARAPADDLDPGCGEVLGAPPLPDSNGLS